MSRDKTATELSEALFTKLQSETLVLLHTIDAETGAPTSSAISWVYAPDRNKIRFALDQRSRLVNNIRNNEQVALTVFATGTIHSIHGRAQLVTEALEGVPFKLACIDVNIDAVRDAMFFGSKLTVEPEYEKTYDQRAAERLDNQVFTALKKA